MCHQQLAATPVAESPRRGRFPATWLGGEDLARIAAHVDVANSGARAETAPTPAKDNQ